MTFRMDSAHKLNDGLWVFNLKMSFDSGSQYISLFAPSNKKGLYRYDGLRSMESAADSHLFIADFEISENCECSAEAAYLVAAALLGASYGPMLDMNNDVVEENSREIFNSPGCIGKFR